MPLKKSGLNGTTAEAPVSAIEQVIDTAVATPMIPKAAPKQTVPKGAKLDKEDYWNRKEERDIETGKRIRRSGVWQAALQSMSGLQFNQGGTLESYLELVDKIADRGLQYVNKD